MDSVCLNGTQAAAQTAAAAARAAKRFMSGVYRGNLPSIIAALYANQARTIAFCLQVLLEDPLVGVDVGVMHADVVRP